MTDTPSAPDFAELNDLLQEHGAMQGAAELHGLLTGALTAGRRYSRSEWLRAVVEQADLGSHPDERTGDALYRLYEETLASLTTDELDFEPMLAADETRLFERAAALGQWCQGFLSGFGMAGGNAADEEVEEALRDLAAVAQVSAEDESEESENDFFAVAEYVRLAVLNIAWLSQRGSAPKGGQPEGPAGRKPQESAGESKPNTPASLFQRNKLH